MAPCTIHLHQPVSLFEALEAGARRRSAKIALLWRDQAWTYYRLMRDVRCLSNAWIAQGTWIEQAGSRYVACFLDKRPEWVATFVAAGGAGYTYVPCNPSAGAELLKWQLLQAPPSWIVIEDKHLERIVALVDETGIRPRFVVVDGPRRSDARYLDWDALLAGASATRPRAQVLAEEIAYLNLTSGTSGKPKLARTTHANIYWNVISASARLRLTQDDVFLCGFPAHLHPHETIARGLVLGGTVLLEDAVGNESGLEGFWQALRAGVATAVMANPAVYSLLAQSTLAGSSALAAVHLFESGGSPAPADLIQTYRERFASPLVPVWGSTETTGIVLAAVLLPQGFEDGILGTPCPYYEVQVIASHGGAIRPGEVGELLVAGPAVVDGYLTAVRADRSPFANGWYHTGDLVVQQQGNLYFVGRADCAFKSGGLKVHPEEVEAVLLRHPVIRDAAVVGVPDAIRGQAVKALIVLRKGASLSRAELVAHCLPHLEPHRIPRLIDFIDKLPRADSGKLLRSQLDNSSHDNAH